MGPRDSRRRRLQAAPQALINLARRTAEQVQTRRRAIPLEAMSPYERRIIHMTLADSPDVTTESTGAEPERRVVILPK